VSVDVAAELPARVSLAAVLDRAGETLRALLGLDSGPPELAVIDGWRVEDHLRVPSGPLLSAEDLASTMIGEPIRHDSDNRTREGATPLPRGTARLRCIASVKPQVSGYLGSSPVIVRPISIRWISDVPSKIVKILATPSTVRYPWTAARPRPVPAR
jgi:hypothetical protein